MGVDGDGGEPVGRRDVGQVLAEAVLVDRKVVGERQQHSRDNPVGHIMGVTGHLRLSWLARRVLVWRF